VDVIACGVDVRDETVDESVVVGKHFDRVAAENRKIAEIRGQGDGLVELGADIRVKDIRVFR